ncbi:MAG: DUF1743 domain-containing protein [Methanomicrobiales archaeon]|nr:DUF1743 domain-containing protein [Methanomicrobiales archaeon]
MNQSHFFIGIDDTDAPDGMCTTWLGTILARMLQKSGMQLLCARLVRLNPTIPYKTRGNAAISLEMIGNAEYAFSLACDLVARNAVLSCQNTNPGIVVSIKKPPSDFYWKAVSGICTIEEAIHVINKHCLYHKKYKLGRGLIGATAAICSEFPDKTWEFLAYRNQDRLMQRREIEHESFYLSEKLTFPHTWDTWDEDEGHPVCVPHSYDPVLYGIRGDTPFSVTRAVSFIISEPPGMFQVWETNQGTDAHLVQCMGEGPEEGISYLIQGKVLSNPVTGKGGHVSFILLTGKLEILCMAFEPTKKFRDAVRSLKAGDKILVMGSYLKKTLNLEKFYLFNADPVPLPHAPLCPSCKKRMTSAGLRKGYKCRICGQREREPDMAYERRTIHPGWYEVPPGARRHLARPLARGMAPPDATCLPINQRSDRLS